MKRFQFDWLLWNLKLVDMQELVDHGAIADRDYQAWDAFCADRLTWYLSASRPRADAVFKALVTHKSGKGHARALPPPTNMVPFPKKRGN